MVEVNESGRSEAAQNSQETQGAEKGRKIPTPID